MTLADRVHRWLELAGPRTADEIARGIKVRAVDVREALRGDFRFELRVDGAKHLWAVRAPHGAVDARPGRATGIMAGSQNARVLAALADGVWHTVPEIHARVGGMRLNSRVAELRAKGYDIRCRTVQGRRGPDRYEYRLLSEPGASQARPGSESSLSQFEDASLSPSRVSSPPAPVTPSAGAGLQLTLEGAFA